MAGKVSRFDLILIVDIILAVCFIAQESWLRVNAYGDLPSGCWTFLTTVFGGEILTFSLYQIIKEVNRNGTSKLSDIPKTIMTKRPIIKELEEAHVGDTDNTGTGHTDANSRPNANVPNIS